MPTGYATKPRFLNRNHNKLSNQQRSNYYSKQIDNSGYQTMDHGSYYYSRNGIVQNLVHILPFSIKLN